MPSRYYNNPHFNPFGPQTNARPRFLPGFSGLGRLGFRGFGIGQEMVGGDVDLQVYKPPPPPAVAPPPPPWYERESLLSFLPNWLTVTGAAAAAWYVYRRKKKKPLIPSF